MLSTFNGITDEEILAAAMSGLEDDVVKNIPAEPIKDIKPVLDNQKPKDEPMPVKNVADSSKVACPHCGKEINPSDAFCEFCGSKVEKTVPAPAAIHKKSVFCESCGKEINPNDAFCEFCGNKVSEDVMPTAPINNNIKTQAVDAINKTSKSIAKNKTLVIIIAAVVFLVIVGIVIACNLHICDSCHKLFFGQGREIYGARVCNPCWKSGAWLW